MSGYSTELLNKRITHNYSAIKQERDRNDALEKRVDALERGKRELRLCHGGYDNDGYCKKSQIITRGKDYPNGWKECRHWNQFRCADCAEKHSKDCEYCQ